MPDNFNMAILGHVDSGKTTLAKALSSFASTAAFDKSPQSQQRGITLDLGFSYFTLSPSKASGELRVTLVDCPGHSSLLKTVMGGLRIVDGAVVVIDVAKGVQAQTAECLALAEIIAAKNLARGAIKNNIFVAVNKIDMLESEDRSKRCNYVAKFLNDKVLKSRSLKTSCVVYVSALNREVEPLIRCLEENIDLGCLRVGNSLRNSCSLILAYEHCFGVKGKGAIITGTVIEGILVANQKVYVPVLDVERKIKSIQMFGQDVKVWILILTIKLKFGQN